MPQLRPSSLPTKSKSSRGSITLLSVVWLAITMTGVMSLARATVIVHERAVAQVAADAIALAAADHGDATAHDFARSIGVTVLSINRNSNTVTARITSRQRTAVASAFSPQ